ncbi:bifunctional pyr operon transcriptional regulator/uracil phosphoribosyltransferase PyrR [Haloglycomyces albus]|uniref:bifunctional pyr operon transcriptional regulator/uracil phosphoribosyltransferase PyrR n=1 Tax=Haloglycomyces albus TaxID=526067 RepID=UPI00046D046E|nr:bifunctional pyr operon transcriptional regulator/uracil phosphoribosyltransferase PyrR [Haloglycomyces albus]
MATPARKTGSQSSGSAEPDGKEILAHSDIARVLDRMAHEILEKTKGAENTILLGIPTRGIALAGRLADRIERFSGNSIPAGTLDITLYRDDLGQNRLRPLGPTDLPTGGVDGQRIVLVDDVLYSGRTIRAALNALYDLGRPSSVQLAILVDRGHRELPIRADYVGKNIPTSRSENVSVLLNEYDETDAVELRGEIE